MQEAVTKNAEVERETGEMAAEKSNNKTKRREGEGEKAAKDTEAGEDVGAASLERGPAGVKTGVTAAKMAEVPRGGGGVEVAEENGPNDGVTGGNSRRTSEDGNRSEKEGVSDEEEEENAEERVRPREGGSDDDDDVMLNEGNDDAANVEKVRWRLRWRRVRGGGGEEVREKRSGAGGKRWGG
ncbi:hypothetical protein CgunFtcFv8_009201 [Champsocephalus gunnari]|uniref:Uncharacterized protein n=1 Tax=Champsocephalus gunnari TaxID=52237 RepID=A0AAN8C1V3_CHAGU|nr:hypothetical protein CgunFtcFv8_009201 [Champsocephalus gunnari]